MPAYLLDTNVLPRVVDRLSAQHEVVVAAIARLLAARHELYLTAQTLIEFWAVATRPRAANGLGWDTSRARTEITDLRYRFPMLEDSPNIFPNWLQLVSSIGVSGRQVHDARLVAVMQVHGISNLLTFNTEDFRRYADIVVVRPDTVG